MRQTARNMQQTTRNRRHATLKQTAWDVHRSTCELQRMHTRTACNMQRNLLWLGRYQIALDESPLAPVRYRTVSFKVTGFCDAPQLSAAAQSGPAVEAARPSAQPSARPTTDATVASGTLIQHRRSREMGTVVGYRGNGWCAAPSST